MEMHEAQIKVWLANPNGSRVLPMNGGRLSHCHCVSDSVSNAMIHIQKEFPELWNFVGGNFHQDAHERGLQPDELVEEESHLWSAPLVDALIADIQRALGYLALDPNAFTVEQLGSEQDTSEYTTRSFLEMILTYAHARKRAL